MIMISVIIYFRGPGEETTKLSIQTGMLFNGEYVRNI